MNLKSIFIFLFLLPTLSQANEVGGIVMSLSQVSPSTSRLELLVENLKLAIATGKPYIHLLSLLNKEMKNLKKAKDLAYKYISFKNLMDLRKDPQKMGKSLLTELETEYPTLIGRAPGDDAMSAVADFVLDAKSHFSTISTSSNPTEIKNEIEALRKLRLVIDQNFLTSEWAMRDDDFHELIDIAQNNSDKKAEKIVEAIKERLGKYGAVVAWGMIPMEKKR